MCYGPRMTNYVKPVRKQRFRSTAVRTGRSRSPAAAVRVAAERTPIHVERDPIPTATGVAHQLGWLGREAALDGTPLRVGTPGERPADLREGDTTRALW